MKCRSRWWCAAHPGDIVKETSRRERCHLRSYGKSESQSGWPRRRGVATGVECAWAGGRSGRRAGVGEIIEDLALHEVGRLKADESKRLMTYAREMELIEIFDDIFRRTRRIARTQKAMSEAASLADGEFAMGAEPAWHGRCWNVRGKHAERCADQVRCSSIGLSWKYSGSASTEPKRLEFQSSRRFAYASLVRL